MWILKKTLSRFLFPVPLCFEVLVIGFLLLCFTPKQKAGKTLVGLAGLLLFLFGSHPIARQLLMPLESRYSPLFITPGAPVAPEFRQAKFIVVLGSSFAPDASRPIEMWLDDDSIARLVEGIRLSRLLSGCKLIVSGGPAPDGAPLEAQAMAQLAEELGVSRQDIILDGQSCDTEEEALHIAPKVGNQRFILVTEASHMPRAMALFKKQGTQPIADPMHFRSNFSKLAGPQDLFPDAGELLGTQRAVYEYLGLTWAKLRGKI